MSSDLRINRTNSVIVMSNNSLTAIAQNQLSIHAAQAKVESVENQFFADMKEQLARILNDSIQLRNRITAISTEMSNAKKENQKTKAAWDDLIELRKSSAETMRKLNADLTQQSEGLTAETKALVSSNKQLNDRVPGLKSSIRYLQIKRFLG